MKESIFKVLDKMPEDKIVEVLDFALFVNSRKQPEKKNIVKRGSFEEFESLAGIVSLGGMLSLTTKITRTKDIVIDTNALVAQVDACDNW